MNNYPDWVVERFGNDEERWGNSNNNDDDYWYDNYEPNDEEE